MLNWPEKYSPQRTAVHVRNELEMGVPPERVWAWLIRADIWPSWFSRVSNVTIQGGGRELQAGSVFRWKTSGVNLLSRVEEFVPWERLTWSAHAVGIDAYHAWLIEKTPSGCRVVTAENQNGWLARLGHAARPHSMNRLHQGWLEGLLERARVGFPP
jgi:uncharacterized protein YndB with AHSA1/START domain